MLSAQCDVCFFTGSIAIPLQIQSNHLEGQIVVTTPIPQYEDIEVTPRGAYAYQKSPNYYDYDYQQDYVQAPSIKYARSTDHRRKSRKAAHKWFLFSYEFLSLNINF